MTTPTSPAKPAATAVGAHLPGLHDVASVETTTFRKAQLVLATTVQKNGIAAVSGEPGNGKSFSVEHFIRTSSSTQDRPCHWLDMPPKPDLKEVSQRLLTAIGIKFNRRDTNYMHTEDLVPAMAGRVLVIDEAQHLKQDGLQQVRYLHDRGRGSWALILVGRNVDEILSSAPELSSRVSSRVRFEPLTDENLLRAVRSWSPLMMAINPTLILRIDANYGHGNWRRWAQLLSALQDVLESQGSSTPTERHVSAALAMVQGA